MPRRNLLILATLLGALSVAPAALAEPPAPTTPPPGFVPGQVIVQWAAGAKRADKVEAREEAEVGFAANLGDPAFQLVQVEPGQPVAAAIDELEGNPAVAVAERDSYAAPTSIPNDPLFGQEWGLQNLGAGVDGFVGATAGADIDAAGAWAHTVGTPATVVADIDTGYRFNSPDLGPVAWENPGEIAGNGIDDDHNGYVDDVHGYDFVGQDSESPTEDADPTDEDLISGGHGVHTAGTIGAAGNNEVGITGVAQDVRIMPLRVCANAPALNESRCPTSSIIAAVNYAGANGARVANISLGGTTASTAELDAFAENPQTLYVIAAGNDAQNNDSVGHYPCDYEPASTAIAGAIDNIVCVAATDQADQLASFSDWGAQTVDLGAPGTQILSTYPAMETLLEDNFEAEDFETKWKAGGSGGFGRTNEAPLTSFGISDSPGTTPVAGSSRFSTLASPVPLAAGAGACRFSGRDFVSLGGGTFTLIIFKSGVSAFSFSLPSTSGAQMSSFTTVPMTGLGGSSIGVRVLYTAGSAPTASSGVWLDDLQLSCYAPLTTAPAYAYLQGTSMATPHVSGAAALLFSQKPAAAVTAVRDALLEGVDPDPSLASKTTSGGRLDVARAFEYLEPPAPQLTATNPASPAEEADPRILGSALAGSTVHLFAGAGCEGASIQQGSAAELASPGLSVHVPDETTAQFSAEATTGAGESPCSAPILYTNSSEVADTMAPEPPTLSSTNPASPSNDNHPKIVGSAEPGSSIKVYAGATCTGTVSGSGAAAELASPGIMVTADAETTTQFSATATDAAENTSGCSAPISYTSTATIGPSTVEVIFPPSVLPPAAPSCTVPKLTGKALGRAKTTLSSAGCALGKVVRAKAKKGRRRARLIVKSSSPAAGASATGPVTLKLGPKPKKRHG